MKDQREIMEDQLESHEKELAELNSYIKELNEMTAKHGTPREHFEEELMRAQHNAKYYEEEVARIRREIGELPKARTQIEADTILPQTTKQGLGSLLFCSVGFLAGVLLGSGLKSRPSSKDREQ